MAVEEVRRAYRGRVARVGQGVAVWPTPRAPAPVPGDRPARR
ncbi:hypothetical protein [Micromonospora sp. DPT]